MTTEELLNIVKVQETYSKNEANDFLSKGWKLINVYTSTFSFEPNDQVNVYVLGKSDDR